MVKSATRQKKHQLALPKKINKPLMIKLRLWQLSLLIPWFLYCSLTTIASAQNLTKRLITSNSIVQDSKGFIWLSTTNGLIRFDSEDKIIFNSNNKDWPLPFNWINDIYPVGDDKLLVATETHKLWLFNTSNGRATQVNIAIEENSIYQLIEHHGCYYLFVQDKLYQVDSTSLEPQLLSGNIDIKKIKSTIENVYFSTTDGIYKLLNDKLVLVEAGSASAIASSEDMLVIAKEKKLITLNDQGKRQTFPIDNPISTLAFANSKDSIFAINQRGYIEHYALSDFTKLSHAFPNNKLAFVDELFHDNTGVLWLLTNQGVKRMTPSLNKNHNKIFDTSINSLALTAHKDQILIGSYGAGLHELMPNKSILPKNINQGFSARGKIITDLYSHKNDVYIATFDGLWQYSVNKKQLTRVNFPNNNKLLLDLSFKDNQLYLASDASGVYIFDLTSKTIVKHLADNHLRSNEAINSLPLADDIVWIATPAGIDIVNARNNVSQKVKSLGENKVISLLAHNNKVFVATKGDGFFVYNLSGELLAHFAKNIIFGYMSVINDEIWISGRPGLYQLNPDSYELKMVANTEQYIFTKKPILLNNTVYAAHYGGVLEVALSQEKTINPSVYISKTIASGKPQLLSSPIKIASSNDVVTLELASLDFRPGQEKQFKYQVNNGEWNDINGNQLTFTGLSSGNYHIEIMGTNSLGQWSDFKAYADIEVAYPWYWHPNSRIIYITLVTLSLLFISWLLYLRSRSITHIHQLLNEEIQTHGQSAAIIRRKLKKIQTLISQENDVQVTVNSEKSQHISHHSQETLILINDCLTELNIQQKHTEPSSLSGSSLTIALPYLADYFHQQYHVLVSVHLSISCEKIEYAIQSAIYSITYEAILAAINNGDGGVFAIHISETKDKVWLKITDNEQSFAQFNSKINFDMAMYYIRQVAKKFNATFHTYDNQEHGSEIIISIPLMELNLT